MSIYLELPGERKELKSSDVGVGKFADVLRAELVAEIYVGAMARGRQPAAQTIEAEPDDVLELGWEGGIVELVRAGDLQNHFPETTRSADGVLKIPTQRRVRSATRGSREINLDFTKHLRLKVADEIVTAVAGFADLDGDGYVEIYAGNDGGANDFVYLNSGGANICLTVRALTDGDGDATDADTFDDRDAPGAHVWVDIDGDGDFLSGGQDRLLLQVVDGGDGDNRAGSYRVIVGLGPEPVDPKVRVRFPDGSEVTEVVDNVAAVSTWTVRDPP